MEYLLIQAHVFMNLKARWAYLAYARLTVMRSIGTDSVPKWTKVPIILD